MSVTINLLPHVRQEKVDAKRQRQLATVVGTVVCAVGLGAVAILFLVVQGQNLRVALLQKDINSRKAQLEAKENAPSPNLVDEVTAQQHLAALPGLYSQRLYLTKLFSILQTFSPRDISLGGVNIQQSTLTMDVTAGSYETARKLSEAMEEAGVTVGQTSTTPTPYFTNVQVSGVAASAQSKGRVTFTITATLAPEATSGSK